MLCSNTSHCSGCCWEPCRSTSREWRIQNGRGRRGTPDVLFLLPLPRPMAKTRQMSMTYSVYLYIKLSMMDPLVMVVAAAVRVVNRMRLVKMVTTSCDNNAWQEQERRQPWQCRSLCCCSCLELSPPSAFDPFGYDHYPIIIN